MSHSKKVNLNKWPFNLYFSFVAFLFNYFLNNISLMQFKVFLVQEMKCFHFRSNSVGYQWSRSNFKSWTRSAPLKSTRQSAGNPLLLQPNGNLLESLELQDALVIADPPASLSCTAINGTFLWRGDLYSAADFSWTLSKLFFIIH